ARVNALGQRTNEKFDPTPILAPAASWTVIGIAYQDANFWGGSHIFTGWGGCDGNLGPVDFWVSDLNEGGGGWNDCISSFRPYGGCAVVLYETRDFWGAATNGGW